MRVDHNICVIATCHRFWRRCSRTLPYWNEVAANGPQGWFDMHIVTPSMPPILPRGVGELIKIKQARQPRPGGIKVESKPAMLKEVLQELRILPPTYVLFTDVDVVPPPDLYQTLIDQPHLYRVAERVDLDKEATEIFLINGKCPSNEVLESYRKVDKKTGMGWFQLVRWEALGMVWDKLPWSHEGYDLFDWELNKHLKAAIGQRVIKTSRPFFHLWHGAPGSTWKGADKDW